MKLKRLAHILCLLSVWAFAACDDSTSQLGSTLVEDTVEIIEDSSFTLTAKPVKNPTIMSRTITQLIGSLDAEGFGRLSSDIVTQFMPSMELDTTGVKPEDVDSVRMIMFFNKGAFTGDSLAPMGVKVYPLTKQLPSPIYSSFDPEGYYDPQKVIGQTVYTGNAMHNDSLQNLSYRSLIVTLPRQFGVDLYNEFYNNPSTFLTPEAFAAWFPGLFITTSFGSGRVTTISETRINVHFKRHTTVETDSTTRDSIVNSVATYMAVTPEVVTNNNLRLSLSQQLQQRIDNGENIITAPTGSEVELTLPINEMLDSYRQRGGSMSVFNTLSIVVPCEEIENDYSIEPPTYMLLVLKSHRDDFFANNELPNASTASFYAAYDASAKSYTFTGMRQYFVDMLARNEEITGDDCTFVMVPVDVEWSESSSSSSSSSVVMTAMAPYISGPAMVKVKPEETKIYMIYSKQNLN